MEPHLADLMDALPEELRESRPGAMSPSLTGLLQEMAGRPVPVGRFHRARILGTLQAKIAVAYLAYWIRTSYKGVEEKQQRLNETHLKAALELLASMSYLRGAVMKIGQLLASYPHVAPEEFAGILAHLHFEAPPMHFSLLREFVRNELGGDPEELFDEFETKAFAAASLGQVHRARLKGTGERVAIKIQYPSIGRAIRDDFRNLKALLFPMRLSGDWDNLKAQFEDMCAMLEYETDYEQEAGNLRVARSAFREEEGIVVPRVYPQFSTRRVLTMDYIDGVHLDAFLRSEPAQEVRDRFGERLAVASLRLLYNKSVLYADPQPGNYYFMPDGRLGLVDFGCCRHFDQADIGYMTEMETAVQTSREATHKAFLHAIDARLGQSVEPDHMRLLEQLGDWLWEPVRHDGRFDFGDPDYFRRGFDVIGEVMRRRYFRSLPVNIWIDRNFLGLRAMLYHLRARVNFGALLRQETTVKPSAA